MHTSALSIVPLTISKKTELVEAAILIIFFREKFSYYSPSLKSKFRIINSCYPFIFKLTKLLCNHGYNTHMHLKMINIQ